MFEESYVPKNSYVDLEDDSKVNELVKLMADLANDGVKYREELEQLESAKKVFKAAQDFIISKGLAEEFNEFCQKVL